MKVGDRVIWTRVWSSMEYNKSKTKLRQDIPGEVVTIGASLIRIAYFTPTGRMYKNVRPETLRHDFSNPPKQD